MCDVSLFYFAIQRASEKRGSLLYVKLSFDLPQFRFVCLVFLFYFAIQRELLKRGVHYYMLNLFSTYLFVCDVQFVC